MPIKKMETVQDKPAAPLIGKQGQPYTKGVKAVAPSPDVVAKGFGHQTYYTTPTITGNVKIANKEKKKEAGIFEVRNRGHSAFFLVYGRFQERMRVIIYFFLGFLTPSG